MLDTSLLGSIAKQLLSGDEVEVEGKRLPVRRTSRQGLRTVTFTIPTAPLEEGDMREFTRPPVVCGNCNAKIYFGLFSRPPVGDPDGVVAEGVREPPGVFEACPRCGKQVDTTAAYPSVAGFPPSFALLRKAYEGFAPRWEHNRGSFENDVHPLRTEEEFRNLNSQLAGPKGLGWYRQRLFYRSCTAFYRSLQLFYAFLVLERHCFDSWAEVTGYYSRFYFIQAFLNLLLCTWAELDSSLFYYDGVQVQCLPKRALSPTLKKAAPHEVWWQLMEALKQPNDFPVENLDFILSRLVFNPQKRNTVNYDFEYLGGGFIELDWFDQGARQMLSHFIPRPRSDRDITDMERYFAGWDPADVDVADFYTDDSQMLWCSLLGYMQLLKALGFRQSFILTENVAALAEVHLRLDKVKYQSDTYVGDWKGLLQQGDVLINSTGTGTLGRAVIFNQVGKYLADGHVTIVRTNERLHAPYFYYLMQSPIYQGYVYAALVAGSTNQIELSREGLRAMAVVLPSHEEQRTIAEFLDRETAKIDALISKRQQLIALLEEKRAALISRAVTKGLKPSSSGEDSGVEWIGVLPEAWNLYRLRRVVDKFVDYRGATPQKAPDGIPLVTARNIKNGNIDMKLSEEFIREEDYDGWMVRGFPEVGDVLLTTEAPLGESAQVLGPKIALAQRIILLKRNKHRVTNDFLKYYFLSQAGRGELWSRATGSTALGIKASHLKEISVTVPPLDEQPEITCYLDQRMAELDELVAKITDSIKTLAEFRAALISAAVTGKIDVRGQVQ